MRFFISSWAAASPFSLASFIAATIRSSSISFSSCLIKLSSIEILLNIPFAVADYFNGEVLTGQGEIDVFATRGNKIQIILYAEYLLDQLLIDLKKAKKEQIFADRCFNYSFRKTWALNVAYRLSEMKKQERSEGTVINNVQVSGLALQDKDLKEKQTSLALRKQKYPRVGTRGGYTTSGGQGATSGGNYGRNVGLNRQVSGRAAYRLGGS